MNDPATDYKPQDIDNYPPTTCGSRTQDLHCDEAQKVRDAIVHLAINHAECGQSDWENLGLAVASLGNRLRRLMGVDA